MEIDFIRKSRSRLLINILFMIFLFLIFLISAYAKEHGCEKHCLRTWEGGRTNPRYKWFESRNYTEDEYCIAGNWSSRTKLVAFNLLKVAQESKQDYTIFCDEREGVLNYISYYIEGESETIEKILTSGLNTNNFCVLNIGNDVFVAASLNNDKNKNDRDDSNNEILKKLLKKNIFGIKTCGNTNAFEDDGTYHNCDSSKRLWFNKRLNSFIYTTKDYDNPTSTNNQNDFFGYLFGKIRGLNLNSISDSEDINFKTYDSYDNTYLKGINRFKRLYISKKGELEIKGTIEGVDFKNALIEYKGFTTDICKFLNDYKSLQLNPIGISCKSDGSGTKKNYYVLLQGSEITSIDPDDIWEDLTSKLRLKLK